MALLEVIELRREYVLGDVTVHALRGVTLSIDEGAFVAIVGASGSGKSTLMNILGLLDRPSSGRYLLRGEDVSTIDPDRRARLRNQKIGFVFQSFNLLPRTSALENVELPLVYDPRAVGRLAPEVNPGARASGARATSWLRPRTPDGVASRHERARRLLEAVGLGERVHHTPSQLSGGQQQRVAVARALVNEPELVLADEPTGNLDSRTSVEVMELLQRLNRERGITIVLITHERDIAEYAQRVISVRDGRVQSDQPVTRRRDASDELAHLPVEVAT